MLLWEVDDDFEGFEDDFLVHPVDVRSTARAYSLMCEYSSGSNDIEELQWRFGALFELEKPRGCTGGFTWEKRSEEREDDECLGGVFLVQVVSLCFRLKNKFWLLA